MPDDCEACAFGLTRGRFVVSWHNVPHFNDPTLFSFQVVLHEDGTIAFQYEHMHNWVGSTVGIEDGLGDYYVDYEFETINLPDDVRLQWSPGGDGFELERSLELSGPPYEWITHDDAPNLGLGDDASQTLELPFEFPFEGRTYTTINVASNGYVWLGSDPGSPPGNCCVYQEQPLPTSRTWEVLIAPSWDDWNPAAGGHVHGFSRPETCALDCTGEPAGYARLDECGVCTGGTTGLRRNLDMDCAGVCYGDALLDACGACAGGTTGREPNEDDIGCGCFEDPPSSWYPDVDEDGLGAGEPVTACRLEAPTDSVDNADDLEPDCATNDTALCGECGALDCNDECGGGAAIDACGLCAGGSTGLDPVPDPTGCAGPDLTVDRDYLASTLDIDHVFIQPDDCYVQEQCVLGSGDRRVLRFGTMIANIGNEDLVIGPPGTDGWVYAECHDHFHFADYAFYQLFTAEGREVQSIGYKNGWCVMDITQYGGSGNSCRTYTCASQGISAGCADIYSPALQCQWIDVTGVPDGEYLVRVVTNPDRNVYETNYSNNFAEVKVLLEGDTVTLIE